MEAESASGRRIIRGMDRHDEKMGAVTLGVVDNDRLTLAALSGILHDVPWLTISWTVASGDDAVDCCLNPRTRPQVVLVDMSMERMSGAMVCRTVRLRGLPIGLVCMTSFSLRSYASLAAESGAQALVSKTDLQGLAVAVHRAAAGLATQCPEDDSARFLDVGHVSGGMTGEAVESFPGQEHRRPDEDRLSVREVEILRMYSEGMETEEIARSLALSKFTVGTYVKRAVSKMHARNRIHAIAMCEKRGLL